MKFWHQIRDWVRAYVRKRAGSLPPASGTLEPMRPRVLLVVYDPEVSSEGGRKLSQVMGWHDSGQLAQQYIADLGDASGGLVDYQIIQRIDVDGWPPKGDGFSYDADGFLTCWRNNRGFHEPDAADYPRLIADLRLAERVKAGQIDEVWLFCSPYAGFYESIMAGPGAFWCNSPPVPDSSASGRRYVLMGFNYERDAGPMLESFGHRVEAHLKQAWRQQRGENNLWQRFTRYDQLAPGQAACGNVHFAPNSVRDYDWGNPAYVPSNCDDWLNFPAFQGLTRRVNCAEWGEGEMRAHHLWWLRHLPRAEGRTLGISNNWWLYAVEPNAIE